MAAVITERIADLLMERPDLLAAAAVAEAEATAPPPVTQLAPGYLDSLIAERSAEPAPVTDPAPEPQTQPQAAAEPEAAPVPAPPPAPAPSPEPELVRGAKAAATIAEQTSEPVVRFLDEVTVPGDAAHYVPGPVLRELYDKWRVTNGAPALTDRQFGMGLTAVVRARGFDKKQATRLLPGLTGKPILYYGLRLREHAQTEAPTSDTSAPADADAIREAARKAREARGPRVVVKDDGYPEPADDAAPLLTTKDLGSKATRPQGGVTVVGADGKVKTSEMLTVEADPDAPPLEPHEADATTYDVYEDCKGGFAGKFTYHPDVLALYGLDQDQCAAAIRQPQRVEIRPESKSKGYPVLAFIRGDMRAILGFRNRNEPAVIAAYWLALMQHDTHRVDHVGGGGAKREAGSTTGVPTNPKTLMRRLRSLGAQVVEDAHGEKASVKYAGQDLGKVSIANRTAKAVVQTDWQRCQRKIHAIAQREKVATG